MRPCPTRSNGSPRAKWHVAWSLNNNYKWAGFQKPKDGHNPPPPRIVPFIAKCCFRLEEIQSRAGHAWTPWLHATRNSHEPWMVPTKWPSNSAP